MSDIGESELLRRIAHLLDQVGQRSQCMGCNAPIMWVTHRNGKKTPYTLEGLNHFIDCKQASMFRRSGT